MAGLPSPLLTILTISAALSLAAMSPAGAHADPLPAASGGSPKVTTAAPTLNAPTCDKGTYTQTTFTTYIEFSRDFDFVHQGEVDIEECQQRCNEDCSCTYYQSNVGEPHDCFTYSTVHGTTYVVTNVTYDFGEWILGKRLTGGIIVGDPRIVGGNGRVFHFNGQPDTDFCLVSDRLLQINSHFIGRLPSPGIVKLMTWIDVLSIQTAQHSVEIRARRSTTWRSREEHLEVAYNGQRLEVPVRGMRSFGEITVVRGKENEAEVRIASVLTVAVRAASVKKEWWTEDDCFVHLDMHFKKMRLSDMAHGILGQTYRPSAMARVSNEGPAIVGRMKDYITSSQWATDCKFNKYVAQFAAASRRLLGDAAEQSFGEISYMTVEGKVLDDNEEENLEWEGTHESGN